MELPMRCISFFLAAIFFVLSQTPAKAQNDQMEFFVDQSENARFFDLVHNGGVRRVYASGVITDGTTERFLTFVQINGIDNALVHLSSPGGSLAEGIRLGKAIRSLSFSTTVGDRTDEKTETSVCASACAYAFAGGTSRFLSDYTGKLGIHQFYSSSDSQLSEQDAQIVSGVIVAYLSEMGIDAKAFALSTVADRDGMIWLTPSIAEELLFANNGVAPTTSEIKLADMMPYLKLEQERHDSTARVLLYCHLKVMHIQFGIVTNPETAKLWAELVKTSYLEVDGVRQLAKDQSTGITVNDATVWIDRPLSKLQIGNLIKSRELAGWLDGYGAVRWGTSLDLRPVSQSISAFSNQCYNSN